MVGKIENRKVRQSLLKFKKSFQSYLRVAFDIFIDFLLEEQLKMP